MNCEFCKVNKAIIHITEVEGGTYREIHLCQACAESSDVAKIVETNTAVGFIPLPPELAKAKCNICGSSLADFSKRKLLGCANDYYLFGKILIPLIEKIHHKATHKGKVPLTHDGKFHNLTKQIQELEIQLKEAVKKEDFETAAKIRDKIKALKQQLNQKKE